MEEFEVLWLSPRITVPGNFARRRLYGELIDEVLAWKERLGNCPEASIEKILFATTQFCLPQLRWRIENILDNIDESGYFFLKVKSVRGL
jgi:hypothetical protein